MIKFGSDLREVDGFLRVLRLPPLIKLTYHEITEILLKVPLNTITLKLTQIAFCESFETTQTLGIFRQYAYLDTKLCVLL